MFRFQSSGERLLAAFAVMFAVACTAGRVDAQEAGRKMQLEVIVNGTPTQLIGSFVLRDNGQVAAKRAELEEIGLDPRGYATPDTIILLNNLPGLSYRYEEASQRIFITAPDELRTTKEYIVSNRPQENITVQSDYGAVLNYFLFTSGASSPDTRFALNGGSATLDARVFTPFGTLSQSMILRSFNDRSEALRLNSGLAYSNPETLTTYRVGDAITGGDAWTRPIRMGGFQVQRNFGLRPDLVTLPLPSAIGTAAVPSTADVYINGIKTFSQDVGAGPYRLSNLPAMSGSGDARVVLRDASGRETQTSLPFYASPKLLAPGLSDYSFEVGAPRISYGTISDAYIAKPVSTFSMRYGTFDWLTLIGHGEAGAGLLNGSVGVAARTGSFGVATIAGAASSYGNGTGYQSYLAYETKILGFNVSASSQLTYGRYQDLASVTARLQPNTYVDPLGLGSFFKLSSLVTDSTIFINARPPKALNRVSVGIPLLENASLSATFIQSNDGVGTRSNIVAASLSVGLPYQASLFATAFTEVSGKKNTGVLVGLSMPLGNSVTVGTSVSGGAGGTSVNFEAVKPLDIHPGSLGWRVRDSEGATAERSAAVSYRSDAARTDAGISQFRHGYTATASVEGAVVTMGQGVFFANRIDDAFAVVETGTPGVEVYHENRSVGVTDSAGRALVTGLRSYQRNKIAIDTSNLPLDADVTMTQTEIAPADRSGVRVNLAVKTDVRSALVVLRNPNGLVLPAGSQGHIEGGESFVVGYDGAAYIKSLADENLATITTINGECHASFRYTPRANQQVVISPVICR